MLGRQQSLLARSLLHHTAVSVPVVVQGAELGIELHPEMLRK